MTHPEPHQIERRRHDTKRRLLTAANVIRLTPKMVRVDFTSPELEGVVSAAPDDHIKLFLPDPKAPDGRCMRDYTPRAFDAARGVLTIDFALHESGPATDWARAAKVGDTLEIGGPRGSAVVPDDFDFYLLVGDETALPAIARRLEELRASVPVTAVVVVDDASEEIPIQTQTDLRMIWVHRAGQHVDDGTLLHYALTTWRAPAGEGYVWIGAEARTARRLRNYMLEDRGHPRAWVKAAGYWVRGEAGASDKGLEA